MTYELPEAMLGLPVITATVQKLEAMLTAPHFTLVITEPKDKFYEKGKE